MKRWMKYVKPYLPYFIIGPLCMILEVIGEVLMPKFLAQVINNAADKTPWFSVGMAGLMILTAVLMMAGGVGGAYFGGKASVYFASDLRRDVYKKVQKFSFENISLKECSVSFSRVQHDSLLTSALTSLRHMLKVSDISG